ncbi:hypothetical protein BaRGS_00025536 [Batillaria attramentaria]|uniref:Uncharacterized protein n=1 Tax=Batillaria attramentaria TaxID=370345 RepID=A0ABD0K860_9CAEN
MLLTPSGDGFPFSAAAGSPTPTLTQSHRPFCTYLRSMTTDDANPGPCAHTPRAVRPGQLTGLEWRFACCSVSWEPHRLKVEQLD